MGRKVLYASDLDRTLIFSGRFLNEHPTKASYSPCEYKDIRVISFMADDVKEKLKVINSNENCIFVPVTTRSLSEYQRINLGVKPKYAITSNGGIILKDGEPLQEWTSYVKSKLNTMETLDIVKIIEDEMTSVDYTPKLIDGCYIFFKTDHPTLYDQEVLYLMAQFNDWDFIRQRNKCYAVPKHFSKQIALRWLWRKLDKPYIVASGDSELDLAMLTLADWAVIPKHGTLISERYVEDGTIVDGGILSPLETMKIVEERLNS